MLSSIVVIRADVITVMGNVQQSSQLMGITMLLSFVSGVDGVKKESVKVIGGEAEKDSCFDDDADVDANGFGTCQQHLTSQAGKEFCATTVSTAWLVPRHLSW